MTAKRTNRPTSEAQIRANKQNSKRSTGPKSESGKATSSLNATVHGVYAQPMTPLTNGPHREDADELAAFHDAVVAALAPRDILEEESAREIARIHTSQRRLAVFEGLALDDSWTLTIEEQRAAGGPEKEIVDRMDLLALLHLWEKESTGESDGFTPVDQPSGGASLSGLNRPAAAVSALVGELENQQWPIDAADAVRSMAGDALSNGEQDYSAAYEKVIDTCFPDRQFYQSWIVRSFDRCNDELSAYRARVAAISASKALAQLDRTDGVRIRINTELRSHYAFYKWLQSRTLD